MFKLKDKHKSKQQNNFIINFDIDLKLYVENSVTRKKFGKIILIIM